MTRTFTIELPPRAIRALSVLQDDNEQIPARCGIRVEITRINETSADVKLVATNGRVLGIYNAEGCAIKGDAPYERGGFTYNFRPAIKLLDKKSIAWIAEITLHPKAEKPEDTKQPQIRLWDLLGGPIVSGTGRIDGFPDWRDTLLPKAKPQPVFGTFSLELLGLFTKAQRQLGKQAEGGVRMVSYPRPPEHTDERNTVNLYTVHLPDPNFMGFLMPMQNSENPLAEIPRWIA